MTNEEKQAKLQQLQQLKALKAERDAKKGVTVPEGQAAFRQQTTEGLEPQVAALKQLSPAQQKISEVNAMVTGMMQSIPFSRELGAGVEAVRQATSGETELSLDAISENYKRNKETYDYSVQRVKDAHPLIHEASDMAFSVVRGVVQPQSLGADMVSGAVEGVSRDPDRSAEDAYAGAISGFVFNRLGMGIGKGIQKVGSLARKFSEEGTQSAVGAISKAETRKLNVHLLKSGQTTKDFANNLYSQKLTFQSPDGTISDEIPLFELGQAFDETLDKVKVLKDRSGKAIGSIISQIDETLPAGSIDPAQIHAKLKDDILAPLANSDSPDHQILAKKVSSYLEDMFMEPTITTKVIDGVPEMEVSKVYKKDWSLRRIQDLKVDIANKVSREFSKLSGADEIATSAQKRDIVSKLTDYMEEVVDNAPSTDPKLLQTFKGWKKEYGNLSMAEELLETKVMEQNGGFLAQVQKSLKVRGLVVGLTSHAMGGINPIAAVGVAATINQMLESPAAPATVAVGMKRLADYIQANPNSPMTQRVVVGAGQSLDTFRNAISSSIAEMDLRDNPIKRSTDDLINRQSTVSSLLQYHAPDAAKKFRQLAEEGDETALATFLSELSNDPRASKFIEPGRGVNGKAWTEQDMKTTEDNIRAWNPPAHVRFKMLEQLRSNKIIPEQDWVATPPKEYQPRDKKQPRY